MRLTSLFADLRRMSLLLITMVLKTYALDNGAAGMKFGKFHFAYKLYLIFVAGHHIVK